MKKVLFSILTVLLVCSVNLVAQQAEIESKPERKEHKSTMTSANHARSQADGMKEMLDLNEEQAKEVLDLFLKIADERSRTRERFDNRGPEMGKILMTINEKRETELIKILTAEQWATYKQSRKRTP